MSSAYERAAVLISTRSFSPMTSTHGFLHHLPGSHTEVKRVRNNIRARKDSRIRSQQVESGTVAGAYELEAIEGHTDNTLP